MRDIIDSILWLAGIALIIYTMGYAIMSGSVVKVIAAVFLSMFVAAFLTWFIEGQEALQELINQWSEDQK